MVRRPATTALKVGSAIGRQESVASRCHYGDMHRDLRYHRRAQRSTERYGGDG